MTVAETMTAARAPAPRRRGAHRRGPHRRPSCSALLPLGARRVHVHRQPGATSGSLFDTTAGNHAARIGIVLVLVGFIWMRRSSRSRSEWMLAVDRHDLAAVHRHCRGHRLRLCCSRRPTRRRSSAARCASSRATRSRTSVTRSCSNPLNERAIARSLDGLTPSAAGSRPSGYVEQTSARSSSAPATATEDRRPVPRRPGAHRRLRRPSPGPASSIEFARRRDLARSASIASSSLAARPRPRRDRSTGGSRTGSTTSAQAARRARPAGRSASRPASASSRRSTAPSTPCPGPLSEEFARMLGEVRAGASRADAMRALEQRTNVPELRSFVLAILQADTFGVSIGRVLRAQADEMRDQAPPAGPGEGPEGAGEDAHPDGVLHLPRAVRRGARPRRHQHHRSLLTAPPWRLHLEPSGCQRSRSRQRPPAPDAVGPPSTRGAGSRRRRRSSGCSPSRGDFVSGSRH